MPTYFEQFLHDHRQGGMLADLDARLEEAVADAAHSSQTATITITLEFKPNGDETMFVSDKIVAKKPQPKVASSLFFVTPSNRLSRKNPNQMTLEDFTRPGGD